MNVPIVVICLLAGRILVPESRDPTGGRLDLGGATLSTAGLTAIVWAIISGPERGWASAPVLGVGTAGVFLLALFVGWERRCAHPMLDTHFFRARIALRVHVGEPGGRFSVRRQRPRRASTAVIVSCQTAEAGSMTAKWSPGCSRWRISSPAAAAAAA